MSYDQKESLTGYGTSQPANKFTFYLFACCLAACLASLQFGYNIGVTNLPTQHILDYYCKTSSESDYQKLIRGPLAFQDAEANLTLDIQHYETNEEARARFIHKASSFNQTNNQTIQAIKAFFLKEKEFLANKTKELNAEKSLFDTKYAKFLKDLKQYQDEEASYEADSATWKDAHKELEKLKAEGNTTAYDILNDQKNQKDIEFTKKHGKDVLNFLMDTRDKLDAAKEKVDKAWSTHNATKLKLEEDESKLREETSRLNLALDEIWTGATDYDSQMLEAFKEAKTLLTHEFNSLDQPTNLTTFEKIFSNAFEADIQKLKQLTTLEHEELVNKTRELDGSKNALKSETEKIKSFRSTLWTITNCLFVLGGMIGAICSKYISDSFGRRNSIIIHNIFSVVGALLALLSDPISHYSAIKLSRFFYGVQGGMACSLVPSYLNEISPSNLRGVTGVINQLCITVGILISQVLGFRQLLGTAQSWSYLLGLPIIPAVVGSVCLLVFFPKTPHELLKADDEEGAKNALKKLRNKSKVTDEVEQIKSEVNQNSGVAALSILQIFKESRLRWPILTGMIVHLSQQLCGINAIFFYSESIFRGSGITGDEIQYAVMLTGLINVISTLVAVPLIEKLGRKPLLVLPMAIMIVDFIALTVFLKLAETSRCFSYLGIVCILLFIVCFAVGLGPIPFLFVAECFEPHTKSAAMAICIFVNWASNLLLVLAFPYLNTLMGPFVFLVFAGIVCMSLTYIIKKVPETKDKTVEQIITKFNSGKFYYSQPSSSNVQMQNLSNNERI